MLINFTPQFFKVAEMMYYITCHCYVCEHATQ